MSRPRKCRSVCKLPEETGFAPTAEAKARVVVTMAVEEYESIRLIDLEGMTQQECGESMQVARTTVQALYAEARKKIADCLVNGKILQIVGGDYRICGGIRRDCCHKHGCPKRDRGRSDGTCEFFEGEEHNCSRSQD